MSLKNLKTLKLITIFAPAIAIGTFEVVRHTIFVERDPMIIGNLVLLLSLLIGSFFFSQFVFGMIERTQRESLRRNQELATLNSVALAANESLNLEVVLFRALDKLLQTTGAEAGEIFIRDEHTQEMVQRVHSGLLPEGFHDRVSFKTGEGFVGAVVEAGEPIVIDDVSQERWLLRDKVKENGLDCLVGVPLKSKNSIIGVIILATFSRKPFTADDTRLLVSIGNQMAVAIENARLHEKVQGMAALEERERIAREMHDGIAQVLSYVNTKTQAIRQVLATGKQAEAEAYLKELEDVARDAYADVREAILGLRSTDILQKGIMPTLKEYMFRFSQLSNIKTEFEVNDGAVQSLPAGTELQIIRIIQESLTNVRKHAQARHAWVRISTRDGHAVIAIEDDGQGFDPTAVRRQDGPHFGLQTMRERSESIGASLKIASAPGKGTKVTLTVPLTGRVKA